MSAKLVVAKGGQAQADVVCIEKLSGALKVL
jgi:hypothetical protein